MASGLKLLVVVFAALAIAAHGHECLEKFSSVKNTCKDCENATPIKGTFTEDSFKEIAGYSSFAECCAECRKTKDCVFFSFMAKSDYADEMVCKLFKADACTDSTPFDSSADAESGGNCSPSCKDDPHFVGAHGVRYDFNGIPEKTFCLVTDEKIHINIKLSGYYAENSDGTKAVRSWIRELVYFWRVGGEKQTLHMVARSGSETARANGFMESITFNGKVLPRFGLKDTFEDKKSGLSLALFAYETLGPFQVDAYHVSIKGLFDADVRLRVANPKLRLPNDAETHLNLQIKDIELSSDVHGVLGQTYRNDRTDVTAKFQKLVEELHAPFKADSTEGKGFLDGDMEDYQTPAPLSTACKFDRFTVELAEVSE